MSAAVLAAGPSVAAAQSGTPDAEIRAALINRIDTARNGVGVVVDILSPTEKRFITYGRTAAPNGPEPDRDTLFEIGSITKVFTSLLFADMIERGEIGVDDPVAKYLPAGVIVPSRNGKSITLIDLATHSSGLPRDATNLDTTQLNPFEGYGPQELYAFLASYQLTRDPGERFEYSNVGASLLGHVLALRAGMSYEQLLRARVLQPLRMINTSIALTDQQRSRLATGHDGALAPLRLWEADALPGAGSIRSTADDMLTFAAAWLDPASHPLGSAMRRMLAVTRPGIAPPMTQHLGWAETPGGILFHNGRRGGFSAALTIRPETKQAAIVLSNTVQGVDDLAFHSVNPAQPLVTFAAPRREIAVAAEVLDRYVGVYEFAPGVGIQISRDGARLFGQVTGQGRFELFAETETAFFVKVVDAQITFLTNDANAVTGLVLQQGGAKQPARRVK